LQVDVVAGADEEIRFELADCLQRWVAEVFVVATVGAFGIVGTFVEEEVIHPGYDDELSLLNRVSAAERFE
jgi:hypothetical protein